jgi:hypothetical protein
MVPKAFSYHIIRDAHTNYSVRSSFVYYEIPWRAFRVRDFHKASRRHPAVQDHDPSKPHSDFRISALGERDEVARKRVSGRCAKVDRFVTRAFECVIGDGVNWPELPRLKEAAD